MKKILLLICLALSACATQVQPSSEPEKKVLRMQSTRLDPANGGRLIDGASLQSGDIVLSASKGLISGSIRTLSFAPVSHAAVYLGQNQVAEAVTSGGVRIRDLAAFLDDTSVAVTFRAAPLSEAQTLRLRGFAEQHQGSSYDFVGVLLYAPFSIERRVCELPAMPSLLREACIRGVASIQLGVPDNERFFCSEFVLAALAHAGNPLTSAKPKWLTPGDILHMRENDVSSLRSLQTLAYVGHLKFKPERVLAANELRQ